MIGCQVNFLRGERNNDEYLGHKLARKGLATDFTDFDTDSLGAASLHSAATKIIDTKAQRKGQSGRSSKEQRKDITP